MAFTNLTFPGLVAKRPTAVLDRMHVRKEVSIGGLKFVYQYNAKDYEFVIYGMLLGKRFKLAYCAPTKKGLVIKDFFYGRPTRWPYYIKASAVAKANNRTLGGIVMQIIKEIALDGEVIYVGEDGWKSTGRESRLTSTLLKQAANEILEGGEAVAVKTDAQTYLKKRWQRLHPKKQVSFSDYLVNTARHGWYGAWFAGDQTTKESMIATKTNRALDQHLARLQMPCRVQVRYI